MIGIHINGYKYENADSYRVGNGESTDTVTALDVNWIDGSVEIVAVEGDKITVSETYDGEKEDDRLRWKIENGKLTIKYCRSGRIMMLKKIGSKKLTVEMPRAMLESMSAVDVELVSAGLDLQGVKADAVNIQSVSGDVTLEGQIKKLDIETVSGDLNLTGYIEKADVEGVSATIKATLLHNESVFDVETVSGNVEVCLPEASITGFEVKRDAVGGAIRVDGFDGLTRTGDYCRYGDGAVKINAEAVSGSLTIRKTVTE